MLSVVEAEPAARGIASTVLRDVYLVGTVDEAVEKQGAHPAASFVTPEGVLIQAAQQPGQHLFVVLRNSEVCRQLWPDVAQLIHGEERTTVYP